jgi:VIT1/CCC1 family predicted Fe2+/Mn2+ transporter
LRCFDCRRCRSPRGDETRAGTTSDTRPYLDGKGGHKTLAPRLLAGHRKHVQPLLLRPRRTTLPISSIREIVFGVEDGVVQNMTLIAGMMGAAVSNSVVILAGSVNAIAGVVSMSMGTYLSSQAERDALISADAGPEHGVRSPLFDAVVMAVAYAFGAGVPLVAFIVPGFGRGTAMTLAIGLTAGALFALGVTKAIACGQRRIRAGLQLLTLSAAAGTIGYLVGVGAQTIFHFEV